MKKDYIFKTILFLIPFSAILLLSFSSGNGSALSGSPGDNQNNCTQCHSGVASNSNISITTNIPVTGYHFNTEYDVTITNSAGGSKNGFQVTAEKDSDNGKVGTFRSINAATRTDDNNRRIIHTSQGNNQSSWTFKWTSPSSEQGKITFYGVSVSGNGNGQNSGDQVYLGKSNSNPSLSVDFVNKLDFEMFPNPSSENLFIQLTDATDDATVSFFNYLGKNILTQTTSSSNSKINISNLSSGIYFVKVVSDGKTGLKKFIKQ